MKRKIGLKKEKKSILSSTVTYLNQLSDTLLNLRKVIHKKKITPLKHLRKANIKKKTSFFFCFFKEFIDFTQTLIRSKDNR